MELYLGSIIEPIRKSIRNTLYFDSKHTPKTLGEAMQKAHVDSMDPVEGVCNVFLPYTRFLGFPEFSGYHQWQQESQ